MSSNGVNNIGRCFLSLFDSLIPSHGLKTKTIDSELHRISLPSSGSANIYVITGYVLDYYCSKNNLTMRR